MGKDLTDLGPKAPCLSPVSLPVLRALWFWRFHLGRLQLAVLFVWAALSAWQVALVSACSSSKIRFLPGETPGPRGLAAATFCSIPVAFRSSRWSRPCLLELPHPASPGAYGKAGLQIGHLGFFLHPISCGSACLYLENSVLKVYTCC